MRAGDLNKRLTLQYPVRTPDTMGGFAVVWTTAAEIFGAIWPVSASETVQAGQATMTITHKIRIRYRANVKASWRIKFGSRYFSIVGIINPNESNKLLDLLCREVV